MNSHYCSGKTNRIPFLFWKWLVYRWACETRERKKGPSKNGLTFCHSVACLKMVHNFLVRDYTLSLCSVAISFMRRKLAFANVYICLFTDGNMFVYVAYSSVAWGRSGLPSNVFFFVYCFCRISQGEECERGVIFLKQYILFSL